MMLSIPNGGSAGSVLRSGLLSRVLTAHPTVEIVLLSPLVKDAVFTAEFAHPRVVFEDLSPHRPHGLEARLLAIVQAGYLTSEVTESVRIRRAEARCQGHHPMDARKTGARPRDCAVDDSTRHEMGRFGSMDLASGGRRSIRSLHGPPCTWHPAQA